MLGLARFAALAVLFALAGCVTTENSLSQNDIASMKLTGVTVSFAPEAGIQWEDGIRDMLAPRIKAGVEQAMAGQLNGSRPVRLEIVVKSFVIASAVQRILICGGRGMVADDNLVDAWIVALLIAYPDVRAVVMVGNGI